jgi:disulfide bond formation protein DsbB
MKTQYLVFLISTVATLGSLFFSEVMKLPPCDLCWYQRILMYPVSLITLMALAFGQRHALFYSFPFILLGLGVAGYHNLIYYGVIESIVPCTQGVSCTTRQIEWFGFITIPLLSLATFVLLLAIIIFDRFKKGTLSNET